MVAGATGLLGFEIVRMLRDAGYAVRAMVRKTSNPARRAALEARGAEVVEADVKDRASLESACRGVAHVVSTVTSTMSRAEGDSLARVDAAGQISLIDVGEAFGVQNFVFVSLPPSEIRFSLQSAKRKVEERLAASSMSFTVLQPAYFSEIWLSPAFGFDPRGGKVRVCGSGEQPISWISVHDVARFAVAAVEGRLAGKVLQLGGPDPLSPLDVVRIFEELGCRGVAIEHVPEAVIQAQLANAANELEETTAAVMLIAARGCVIDSRAALELVPGRLATVREYATRVMKS